MSLDTTSAPSIFSSAWPVVALVGEWILRLVFIGLVLLRRRPAATTLAWVIIILAIPIVGIVLYLLIGEIRLGRKRIRQHGEIVKRIQSSVPFTLADRFALRPPLPPAYQHLAVLAESVSHVDALGGNGVTLMGNADMFIQSLVNDIDRAELHCHLLFYIYLTDHSGTLVAEALMRAASRGVACRVLVDAVGSKQFLRSELRRRMEEHGVQVVGAMAVNPLRMLFARIDLRNHRKLAVIDGVIGYTGSQNIADAEFAIKPKYAPWIDCMVRVQGPVVWDLQMLFVEDWYLDTDESLEALLNIQPLAMPDGVAAQVIGTGPNVYIEALRQLNQAALHAAREELIVTSPYFAPDDATHIALCTAARRGVDTMLVLPARNDSMLVAAASRGHYADLLEAGVKIYEHQHGLLHAKTMTIDRSLAIVSSANFDRRSFDLNFEVSMVVYDDDFASQLRFLQRSYIAESRLITAADWARRPWPMRLVYHAAGMFSPLL